MGLFDSIVRALGGGPADGSCVCSVCRGSGWYSHTPPGKYSESQQMECGRCKDGYVHVKNGVVVEDQRRNTPTRTCKAWHF